MSEEDPGLVGYPIRCNKTHQQIQMAKGWVEKRQEEIFTDIEKGRLYHYFSNEISPTELPMQGARNNESFWGNENSSVSTVLLYSINQSTHSDYRFDTTQLRSTATFYPFYNAEYRFFLVIFNLEDIVIFLISPTQILDKVFLHLKIAHQQ